MRKALRWLGIGLGALAGLALVAALVIFAMSERVLRKEYRAAAETLPSPSAALLADAPRQGRILGCITCHGEGLRGKLMFEAPGFARMFAPNIPAIARRASDQQLAAAVRQGIGHDGRGLLVMPSPMFSRLGDGEVAALIAWIRTLPVVAGGEESASIGPIGRFALVTGKLPPAPALIEDFRAQVPLDLGPAFASGRRLTSTNCSECHGPALFGLEMPEGSVTPDLRVAAGYDPAQFRTLLRTGRTPSGKALGLMKEVAVNDFSHFTDAEIDAIHAYLQARAKRLGG
jgi:mono/diheme cytochrome c family protein